MSDSRDRNRGGADDGSSRPSGTSPEGDSSRGEGAVRAGGDDAGETSLRQLAGAAHLWLAPLAREVDAAVIARCLPLLAPDERERHRTMQSRTARDEFLIGRWLARTVLSRYHPVEPSRWTFRSGPQGRPEIVSPEDLEPLSFNLSHTRGLVGCLVTLGLRCGLDVQQLGNDISIGRLAERYLAPEEVAALEAESGERHRQLFYSIWTLKEAYLKARGIGISVPLRHAAFSVAGGGIEVRFAPELGDHERDWQFGLYRFAGGQLGSVAIHRGRLADFPLEVRTLAPGSTEGSAQEVDLLAVSPRPRG